MTGLAVTQDLERSNEILEFDPSRSDFSDLFSGRTHPACGIFRESNVRILASTSGTSAWTGGTSTWMDTRIVTSVTQPDFDVLGLYDMKDEHAVCSFLAKIPFPEAILRAAFHMSQKYFPDSQLALEVITDVEDSLFVQLVIFVQTAQSPEIARANLRKLDAEWLPLHSSRKLLFHIRFK